MTSPRTGHALVLGDGRAPQRAALDAAWPDWDRGVSLVVAADGGARLAEALGRRIDRWVGDADSYPRAEVDRLAAAGVAVRLVPSAKDESDLELAVLDAADAGVAEITVLGGLGGARLDHELANVALLAHPRLAGVQVRLLDEATRVTLLAGAGAGAAAGAGGAGDPARFASRGAIGDLVSLLPVGGAARGITTVGLAYPLSDEPLEVGPARGLSNVRTSEEAVVTVREGRLLVVETPANLAG
jgi:thiamine pyrophosphokinase